MKKTLFAVSILFVTQALAAFAEKPKVLKEPFGKFLRITIVADSQEECDEVLASQLEIYHDTARIVTSDTHCFSIHGGPNRPSELKVAGHLVVKK